MKDQYKKNAEVHNGNVTSGKNISYWVDSMEPIRFEALKKDISTEVVIVGGGIAGLTVAYSLLRTGKKVTLVEDGDIGSGETGRTTAHIVTALDNRYYDLERIYGADETRMIAESHKAAIDFIEHTVRDNNIDCEFKRLDGYLFLDPTDERESVAKELKAAQKAGVEVISLLDTPGIKDAGPSLKFYNQAEFHPLKYLRGLAGAIIKLGGSIYTETQASEIKENEIITQDGFSVKAENIVIATNSPVKTKNTIFLKEYPYRTYVIGARIKKGRLPQALWWDTGDRSINSEIPPYHYVRTQSLDEDHDLLICGGEDHPTGLTGNENIIEEDRYGLLEFWLRKHFDVEDIIYQWSGQVMEPMDGMGLIGRSPSAQHTFIVTGDSGNGITHGTIAGILIPDLINGDKNEWEKIYDPSRFKLFSAGKTFIKEFGGGTIAYLKNKPHHLKSPELSNIHKEEGKIVEFEGKKLGAYRSDDDALHLVSAECTHLGCIIKWNNDEKSWDCPCHGSRFTYDGRILNGPANNDLPYFFHSEK